MEKFNQEQVQKYYLDFDVTNDYEILSFSTLILLNIWLLLKILFNFKFIINWFIRNN